MNEHLLASIRWNAMPGVVQVSRLPEIVGWLWGDHAYAVMRMTGVLQ